MITIIITCSIVILLKANKVKSSSSIVNNDSFDSLGGWESIGSRLKTPHFESQSKSSSERIN